MSESTTFVVRLVTAIVVLAWMQWGPIAHQVMGQKVSWGMNTWRMYYGAARDVCDVRYYDVGPDGSRTPINRFHALGYDHFYDAQRRVRRITDRKHIERQGHEICRQALPQGHHLEADARCASYRGWKEEVFEEPICRGRKGSTPRRYEPRRKR